MKTFFHRIIFWLTVDRICAWCRGSLHRAPLRRMGDGKASHGVCPACAAKVRGEIRGGKI